MHESDDILQKFGPEAPCKRIFLAQCTANCA